MSPFSCYLTPLVFKVLPSSSKWFIPSVRQAFQALVVVFMNMKLCLLCSCFCFLLATAVDSGSSSLKTDASDVEALKQLKAAIEPSSISATSCLASWDFHCDPCQSSNSANVFICGLRCDTVGSKLRVTEITLDNVGYRGTLPLHLGNLSALELLDVSGNAFEGPLPDTLGNLRSLQKLEASGNRFSSKIPETLGKLSSLRYLSLATNALVGPIPASINRLFALEKLSLSGNKLSQQIPPMEAMASLLYFDASNNLLSGWLPLQLPSSLMELSLRMNRLEGHLPKSLNSLSELEVLDLSHNGFSGPVDASLFTLPSLQQLSLAFNSFTALLAMPNLAQSEHAAAGSQLVEIDLSSNQLEGPLPVLFVQMKRVTALSLRDNRFSGIIPIEYALKSVAMMMGAQPLMRLYLDQNFLVGDLPSPFFGILPGQLQASFVGNCLRNCPTELFFCQGGEQRPPSECRRYLTSRP